jgi:Fe-Mn family superoxide dismutase
MNNEELSRRDFINKTGKAVVALGVSATVLPAVVSCNSAHAMVKNFAPIPYTQQPLPYNYSALEPSIDAATMEIHYSKHAATYAKNLAEATTAESVNAANTSLEALLGNISKYSVKMRNNAGGHYNHELFWKMMAPKQSSKPDQALMSAIQRDFGSYEAFTTQFSDAAKNRFGSGWAWLVINPGKKLAIGSTPNQDNPLMDVSDLKGFPVLGLDVWEHAYYLKYQNKRPDYITNWWNVVNWKFVSDRFETAMK